MVEEPVSVSGENIPAKKRTPRKVDMDRFRSVRDEKENQKTMIAEKSNLRARPADDYRVDLDIGSARPEDRYDPELIGLIQRAGRAPRIGETWMAEASIGYHPVIVKDAPSGGFLCRVLTSKGGREHRIPRTENGKVVLKKVISVKKEESSGSYIAIETEYIAYSQFVKPYVEREY